MRRAGRVRPPSGSFPEVSGWHAVASGERTRRADILRAVAGSVAGLKVASAGDDLCYSSREDTMADGDITIEILKDIREEIRATNRRLDTTNQRLDVSIERLDATVERLDATVERLDITVQRLDVTNQRLGVVESTVLGMAEQQRFLVRYTREI